MCAYEVNLEKIKKKNIREAVATLHEDYSTLRRRHSPNIDFDTYWLSGGHEAAATLLPKSIGIGIGVAGDGGKDTTLHSDYSCIISK